MTDYFRLLFASNIFRFQQMMLLRRTRLRSWASSMKGYCQRIELGYNKFLKIPSLEPNELKDYPAGEVLIMCTGSQGEPMAALSRLLMAPSGSAAA